MDEIMMYKSIDTTEYILHESQLQSTIYMSQLEQLLGEEIVFF